MLNFDIITIFPKIFDSYFSESIIARAKKKKLIKINVRNLRDFTTDKHKTVDDRPYGGGPGMILKVEPIYRALEKLKFLGTKKERKKRKELVLMFDPGGEKFDQKMAKKFSKYKKVVLLCGRYEGFDARVEKLVDKKISTGDYILTGGEVPAMAVVDAVSRHIPGVLGKEESLIEETFSQDDYIEYPQYTRPEKFKNWKVPKVLLSGNHAKVKEWKKEKSLNKKSGKR